jgi:hypothetical protein
MARSEMKPTQVKDALPSTYGDLEEKGTRSRGRIELGPKGEKSICSNAYRLRGGGRGDATDGTKEEDIAHIPATSGASYADR